MTSGLKTIIFPVKDLAQSKALYRQLLGAEPYVDAACYVGFRVGDQQLGLDPHGHGHGMTGPIGYWHVPNVKATIKTLVAAGAQVQGPVRDVGGMLIAVVKDVDGNVFGLRQAP